MMSFADFRERGSHGRFHNMHEALKASDHDNVFAIAKAFADADNFELWIEFQTVREFLDACGQGYGLCNLGFLQITRNGYVFKSFDDVENRDQELIVLKSGRKEQLR